MSTRPNSEKLQLIEQLYALYGSEPYGFVKDWQYLFSTDMLETEHHKAIAAEFIVYDGFFILENDSLVTNFYSFVSLTMDSYFYRVAQGEELTPQDMSIIDLCKYILDSSAPVPVPGTDDHNMLRNKDLQDQHPIAAIEGLQTVLDSKADKGSGGEGTTDHRELQYRDVADQHAINAITGLQAALDSKQDKDGFTGDHRMLSNRDAANQHPMTSITGLEVALGAKQDTLVAGEGIEIQGNVISSTGGSGGTTVHGELSGRDVIDQHPVSSITGLQTFLDEKADVGDIPDVSGFITDAPADDKQYGRQNNKWTEITGATPPSDLFNMIPDPHFKFGSAILTDGVYPKLQPSSNAGATIENGILSIKNGQTTAKGFQCWASLPQGWADKFNIVEGSKITIGCYMKVVTGDRDTFTLMQWGALVDNTVPSGEVPYTPSKLTYGADRPEVLDDFQWFQWTVTVRQGGSYRDINDATLLGLAYLQCEDPYASTVPTEIQIKDPCIIMNATGDEQGFYESYRADEYLNPEVLKVESLQMETLSADSITGLTEVDTELVNTGRLELKDNFSFPTDSTFIGKFDKEVVVSELGVQLPLVSRPYTQAEWDALTEVEKSLIEIADVYDPGGSQVAISNPVYTLTEWNALTQEQKDSIEIADVIEG